MGTLFVAATPIGNLGDMSDRLRSVLGECQLVVAEDTRHTGLLTSRLGISPRLLSLNEHNVSQRITQILGELAHGDVVIVSDAGTPAISDPGYQLVDSAHIHGFDVRTIPGPSAVTAALSISGLPATPFLFAGFAPRAAGETRRWFEEWLIRDITLAFFESPNRIRKTIATLSEIQPESRVVICRELTKLHEQTVRSTAVGMLELLDNGTIPSRGEFVVIVKPALPTLIIDPNELIEQLLAEGLSPNETARQAASSTGLPKSDLYRLAVAKANAKSQGD